MLCPRTKRIGRALAHEPEAHLRLWLADGLRRAADPLASERMRAAAMDQAEVCRALLEERRARDESGEECMWGNPALVGEPSPASGSPPAAGAA